MMPWNYGPAKERFIDESYCRRMKEVASRITLLALALPICLFFYSSCTQAVYEVGDLEVSFIPNISPDPVFSWKVFAGDRSFAQGACRVIVSDDPSGPARGYGNIWDSKKLETSFSLQIPYGGPRLEGGRQYFTSVRVWDQNGKSTAWSETKRFVAPLAYPGDWPAEWLTYEHHPDSALPLFRKDFTIPDIREILYARFYISAPGFYEASLNGQKIGKNVLDPGQTNYEDYAFYTAYDIDPQSLSEDNTLGIMLGNGWYNQDEVWTGPEGEPLMVYGQPVFICQLVIHTRDGERQVIASDRSWKWDYGPITYSNIYGGEHHDARREIAGWNEPGKPSGDWRPVLQPEVFPTMLYEQFAEPIRAMDELPMRRIIDKGDGTYIFDMGQNMSGWLRLTLEGERGEEITLRCTEELDNKGNIDPRTTGFDATRVIQTQKYICRGGGTEIWEPRFTYFGFRYVEVEGLKQAINEDLLTGVVVYSAVPAAGSFSCSEENINRLHELSWWTLIGNMHSIPTDCPHREKCGWTGDAHAMIRPMIYNFGSLHFFNKYMLDMRSSAREEAAHLYFGESFYDRSMVTKPAGIPTMIVPGKRTSGVASPDWGTAMVQIPWYLYVYYGDRRILEDFYPDMKTWVTYIQGIKTDGVIPHGLGDWCPPGGIESIDCPVPLSSTAFHILDVGIMARVAALLGRKADHVYYGEMLVQLKEGFNRHFLDTVNFTYGSQTADAMALDMDIVPSEYRSRVAGSIVRNIHEQFDGFLNTGIFGLARIFRVLAENGYEDEVFRLLTRTGRNSFAFMWEKYDATTLWEVLPFSDDYDESIYLRSHSHPMQAGFDEWFFAGIAGINPVSEQPGFQVIKFRPYLTRHLASASASYESGFGTIVSEWESFEGRLKWHIRIPANSRGIIHVPTYGSSKKVIVNGSVVDVVRREGAFSQIGEFGPGEYLVEI